MNTNPAAKLSKWRTVALMVVIPIAVILFFVASVYRRCWPLLFDDLFGERTGLTFAIDGCRVPSESPPAAAVEALEAERVRRGLIFQTFLECERSSERPIALPWESDPHWLPSYICCTWQYRRHVVLAAGAPIQSGSSTLEVYALCLRPRWQYWKQIGGGCEKFAIWR